MGPVCQLFSTLYTTLQHNLMKEKLKDLIECSLLPNTKLDINDGQVKICVKP